MKLVIAKSALKTLRAVQPKLAMALMGTLQGIAADPFGPHPNARRMKGGEDEFRLRHGDWRVLYRLDRAADTMIVTAIDTRGGVYK
jgi:mRNA interferase RelE/StbE